MAIRVCMKTITQCVKQISVRKQAQTREDADSGLRLKGKDCEGTRSKFSQET